MKSFSTSLLLSSLLLALLCGDNGAVAFVKGTVSTRTRPASSMISSTMRMAVAKKGTKKAAKAAVDAPPAAKKEKAPKEAVDNFRKSEFVASIAEKTGMTKVDSETALNAVLDTISDQVVAGKRVSLVGFGTFQLRARAARKGRNPQTGEEIDIKASKSPGFSPAKAFKDKANL